MLTSANGQLAFAHHSRDGATEEPHSVTVLSVRGERIEALVAFLDPLLVERFSSAG